MRLYTKLYATARGYRGLLSSPSIVRPCLPQSGCVSNTAGGVRNITRLQARNFHKESKHGSHGTEFAESQVLHNHSTAKAVKGKPSDILVDFSGIYCTILHKCPFIVQLFDSSDLSLMLACNFSWSCGGGDSQMVQPIHRQHDAMATLTDKAATPSPPPPMPYTLVVTQWAHP